MGTLVPTGNLEALVTLVANSVTSPHSRRAYSDALRRFFVWYEATSPGPFNRAVVQRYRTHIEGNYGKATVNLALSAIRKLAQEAVDTGFLSAEVAAGVLRLKGVKQLGVRTGNWLSRGEALQILRAPDATTLIGKRDRVLLGMLVGCGLRRAEAAAVTVEQIQTREGRQVFADLVGKGKRIRTVPIPRWLESDISIWLEAAGITEGPLLRSFNRYGAMKRGTITATGIWYVVGRYGRTVLDMKQLAPHDLRRTAGKLMKRGGADLMQIKEVFGHSSVRTTEKYIGTLDLENPACDYMGIDPREGV